MLLAFAALAVLKAIPDAAVAAVAAVPPEEVATMTHYRKIGLCKLIEVSGQVDDVRLDLLASDPDARFQRRVARLRG